jgi:hypothetical protein
MFYKGNLDPINWIINHRTIETLGRTANLVEKSCFKRKFNEKAKQGGNWLN